MMAGPRGPGQVLSLHSAPGLQTVFLVALSFLLCSLAFVGPDSPPAPPALPAGSSTPVRAGPRVGGGGGGGGAAPPPPPPPRLVPRSASPRTVSHPESDGPAEFWALAWPTEGVLAELGLTLAEWPATDTVLRVGSTLGLCQADSVALAPLTTYLFIRDQRARDAFNSLFVRSCLRQFSPGRPGEKPADWVERLPLCDCFNSNRAPFAVSGVPGLRHISNATLDLASAADSVLALDQWHFRHHFGHYFETLAVCHAVLQLAPAIAPRVSRIHILKLPTLNANEKEVLDIAMAGAAPALQGRLVGATTLAGADCPAPHKLHAIADRDVSSPKFVLGQAVIPLLAGQVASTAAQARAFRRQSLLHFGWDAAREASECPPCSVLLIYRDGKWGQRRMSNEELVANETARLTGCPVKRVLINGALSLEEQAQLFHSAGIIIAPHSSQLLNMFFAHPNAAILEVVPLFFNVDFAAIATLLGLNYSVVVGGTPDNDAKAWRYEVPAAVSASIRAMSACDGLWSCVLEVPWCTNGHMHRAEYLRNRTMSEQCGHYSKHVKSLNRFTADRALVLSSVKRAARRLNDLPACKRTEAGRWGAVQR